tara:strand:+ start:7659 stop:8237 length:579 start_codon:yes stop_codon:yes gene_type:complete
MSSYNSDKDWGELIERGFMCFLKNHLSEREFELSVGNVPGWDIKDTSGASYEVKWDSAAEAVWKKKGVEQNPTGNVFIEFYNPKMGRDSGIRASTSDWFVYAVKKAVTYVDTDSIGAYTIDALVFDRKQLLYFCETGGYRFSNTFRDVRPGGTPNARGWLVPIQALEDKRIAAGFLYRTEITPYIAVPFLFN